VQTLSLRRRTHVERRVLALLRGEDMGMPPIGAKRPRRTRAAPVATPAHHRRFKELRKLAALRGFAVLAPDTPYVGAGELRLLSWLAQAQRVAGPETFPGDPLLAAAIAHCAGLLNGRGVRLSPLTLYGTRLRGRDTQAGL
jgi:hypothetical protein